MSTGTMRTIVSGIQPSGNLHIGNYIGAMQQWLDLQSKFPNDRVMYIIVDQHAITVPQNPQELNNAIYDLTAWFISVGLKESNSIFLQSDNPNHTYLAWVFDCITPMGWMERMTQYKDKSAKHGERSSVGLFHYPNLMASDILLYDCDLVPVGDDQTQHLELTADIAEKFNRTFEPVFKIPKIYNVPETARIMSLQNPEKKMSKSDTDQSGIIYLSDSPDTILKKVRRAVTDSGTDIKYHSDKPAISNLLAIFSAVSGKKIAKIEQEFEGKTYGEFKTALAENIISHLAPAQAKHNEVLSDRKYIDSVLDSGLKTAREISDQTIKAVRKAVGIYR